MSRAEHRLSKTTYAKQQATRFRHAVKAYRDAHGLTLLEGGKFFGVTPQHLYNVESGTSFPSFSVYVTICKKMGHDPLPIFEGGTTA